jgi:hypothetical protein
MAKLVVDNEEMIGEFFDQTRLLGVVGPMKDYQFCWHLNQSMQIDFRVNNDLEIVLTRKKRYYYFAIYEYPEPAGSLVHYLYNNQFDGEYLLPEFKHLDFLWLMKGDIVSNDTVVAMMQSIREIPGVQLVMELSEDKIKNKGHLIF